MQIDKAQILELLRAKGQGDQVGQADSELPQQVDTEQHAGLLEKFGLKPADVVQLLTGGGGGTGGAGGTLGGLGGMLGR